MATNDNVRALQNLCDDVLKDPINKLVTNPDWGRINFESARNDLGMIVAIATQLKNLPVEMLPEGEINHLISPMRQAVEQISAIRSFSIEQGNAPGVRDNIVNNIRSGADSLFVQSQARLPFLALQRGDVRRNEEAFVEMLDRAGGLLEKAQSAADSTRSELDSIVSAAREASAVVGVAHFTGDFSVTADALENSADKWLRGAIWLGIATLSSALAFPFVYVIEGDIFTIHALQVFTSKLVVVGALFSATVWCGRMFKAAKHQVTVNRHRANSLKTFQAFSKAASDDQTRNAVLLETTKSIFSITSSGYLEGEVSKSDGGVQVLELIRTATDSTKG